MKKTNIYLAIRGAPSSNNRPIKFLVSIDNIKREVDTGYRITTNQWNPNTKKVIRHNESGIINNKLSRWQIEINRYLLANPFSDFKRSKDAILEVMGKKVKPDDANNFIDDWKNYIKKKSYSDSTIKTINSCISKFQKYCEIFKLEPQHQEIDYSFLEDYNKYLINNGRELSLKAKPGGLTNNTIIKHTKYIKQYLEATIGTVHNNDSFRKFKIKSPPSNPITLTQDEISAIEELNLREAMDRVRDATLFCYYTFQRFGDIETLDFSEIDVKKGIWEFRQNKTKHLLAIPLNNKAKTIIKKYANENRLPTISNQKTNSTLKSICKKAGIDQPIVRTYIIGSTTYKENKQKFEFISTHTMRRSAITHALNKGIPKHVVQALSGHSSIKEMDKYIDKSNDVIQQFRELLLA